MVTNEEIKLNNHAIASKRLLLRPITINDTDAIHAYAADKSITMMMYFPKETRGETEAFVAYAVSEWGKENPNDREYVIVYEGKIVGGINLERREDKDTCEMGWIVHKDYRKKGIASEAAKLLLDYAFHTLSVRRVISHCDSANMVSEKVMKKVGMTLIDRSGTRVYPKTGAVSGELLYEIKKEENG